MPALPRNVDGRGIRVRFQLDAPCVVGWQIFDPVDRRVSVRRRMAAASRHAKPMCDVRLPAEDGPYRVQIAPVEHRDQFIVIEARVSDGRRGNLARRTVGTAGALKRARADPSDPQSVRLSAASLWRNRKLIRSMVRRDILARYRGSFGGALWTFLNPLLLMATYAFVFGVVLKTRFGADTTGTGYVLYFLAGMLPWLAFSEAVGRSPYVILEHRNFVKKLVFPLETLPANLVISGAGDGSFRAGDLHHRIAGDSPRPARVGCVAAGAADSAASADGGICWFLAALGIFRARPRPDHGLRI